VSNKGSHASTAKEVLQKLATNENTGLTENEARNRLWKHGPNVLREEKRLVQLIVNQFRGACVWQ